MSYDGTVTATDPALLETWDDIADSATAYVLADRDAEPPDWFATGTVYRVSYSHPRYTDAVSGHDLPVSAEDVHAAWDRFRDWDLVARYLRMFAGAVSVDYSTSIGRDYTAVAVVTRAMAEEWGTDPGDWETLAGETLETYRQWADGEVYGVIVTNDETGEEASLWSIYGDESYLRTVAGELAGEVTR